MAINEYEFYHCGVLPSGSVLPEDLTNIAWVVCKECSVVHCGRGVKGDRDGDFSL